jgi:hypothetical protein
VVVHDFHKGARLAARDKYQGQYIRIVNPKFIFISGQPEILVQRQRPRSRIIPLMPTVYVIVDFTVQGMPATIEIEERWWVWFDQRPTLQFVSLASPP